MTWLWAVAAALAMVGNDLVSTWLVQAESGYRANLAGVLDMAAWPLGMATTYATVEALQGHDLVLKIAVCAAVTAANYTGTSSAVRISRRLRGPVPCCPHCRGAVA